MIVAILPTCLSLLACGFPEPHHSQIQPQLLADIDQILILQDAVQETEVLEMGKDELTPCMTRALQGFTHSCETHGEEKITKTNSESSMFGDADLGGESGPDPELAHKVEIVVDEFMQCLITEQNKGAPCLKFCIGPPSAQGTPIAL